MVDIAASAFGFFFGSESPDIDFISGVADIYYDENHNMPVTKTKYPVEDGSSRTDNFVVEPEQLIMKGIVSDLEPNVLGLVRIGGAKRSKEAWGRIKEMKNSGELVTVITTLGVYENMLVINADAAVNKDTGLSLLFTITLEETQFAETEIVKLAPAKLSDPADTKGSDANGGQKQSEVPGNGTLLLKIVEGISGVFN
jgi:hypothetical protein